MKLKYFVVLTLIFIISCNQQQKEQENQQTSGVANMKLTSPAFANNGAIPSEHTCDGNDLSPQLVISDVPASAKSLALVTILMRLLALGTIGLFLILHHQQNN